MTDKPSVSREKKRGDWVMAKWKDGTEIPGVLMNPITGLVLYRGGGEGYPDSIRLIESSRDTLGKDDILGKKEPGADASYKLGPKDIEAVNMARTNHGTEHCVGGAVIPPEAASPGLTDEEAVTFLDEAVRKAHSGYMVEGGGRELADAKTEMDIAALAHIKGRLAQQAPASGEREEMAEYFDGILNRLDLEFTRTPAFVKITGAIRALILAQPSAKKVTREDKLTVYVGDEPIVRILDIKNTLRQDIGHETIFSLEWLGNNELILHLRSIIVEDKP